MKNSRNKFTVKFALSSQYTLQRCELVVNQNVSYALIHNIISVNLINKHVATILSSLHWLTPIFDSFILSLKKVFIRSLFAHYSLMVRFTGEGTAFVMNSNSNLINSKIYCYGTH
jgi:hypothetical protein